METAFQRLQRTHCAQAPEPLSIALVYDDLEMGVRAKEFADSFAREVGAGEDVRLSVWKYAFFESPELADAASAAAEKADVVVLASREGDQLPRAVVAWLGDWPERRQLKPGALVAAFAPEAGPKPKSSWAGLLLMKVAGRARMDYFCVTLPPTARTPAMAETGAGTAPGIPRIAPGVLSEP